MSPRRRDTAPAVCIVVPCYNEALRLQPDAFVDALEAQPRLRLLFSNDGSTDATASVLEELRVRRPDRIAIRTLAANAGKAEAVRQGLNAALAEGHSLVGFWDADLATPLDAVPEFVALLDARPELEVVIGARVRLLGRNIERNPVRHVLGRGFATIASLSLQIPVYDTQCGAKLFRAGPALSRVLAEPFESRWIFDVELLTRIDAERRSRGLEGAASCVCELPLRSWRDVKGSRVKAGDFVKAGGELLRLVVRRAG